MNTITNIKIIQERSCRMIGDAGKLNLGNKIKFLQGGMGDFSEFSQNSFITCYLINVKRLYF